MPITAAADPGDATEIPHEAEAAAGARVAAQPDLLIDLTRSGDAAHPDGAVVALPLPPGWTAEQHTVNLERWQPAPTRARGTTTVRNGDSFATAVTQQRLTSHTPRLYADENALTVTAVLNQTQNTATGDLDGINILGWGDYRVHLALDRTPAWKAWSARQGLRPQIEFADFIEEHLDDLAAPDDTYPDLLPATDLLDLAQHLQLHRSAHYKRAERLQTGRVQLTYEEADTATAGARGNVSIPEEIHVLVRPFVGADIYRVKARFRYRIADGGDLFLGYKLIRPEDTERAAFLDELTRIETALELPVVRGDVPPATPLAS